jgi:predicted nucleotidyltransferase
MTNSEEETLRRAAEALYNEGAKRVWLFGARANSHPADSRSDLDLAIEGVRPERLPAIARLIGQMVGMKVDLIDMQTAPSLIRPHILRTRKLLAR